MDLEPRNELGVIALFCSKIERLGIEIIDIKAEFPDAIILWNDETYRVEFEYVCSNFKMHDHDPRCCDLIICWKNDTYIGMPSVELSSDNWHDQIQLISETEKELLYWKWVAEKEIFRNKRSEGIIKQLETDLEDKITEIDDLKNQISDLRSRLTDKIEKIKQYDNEEIGRRRIVFDSIQLAISIYAAEKEYGRNKLQTLLEKHNASIAGTEPAIRLLEQGREILSILPTIEES